MQNNPLITVIVPCYNVEKYLNRCVDSILNQTYTNLEIILVDDGSPDRCGEICDWYASKDKRVRVKHQKNQGVSVARNEALEIMLGEYVTFVDSDDVVAREYIETLFALLQNNKADISVAQWTKFNDERKTDFITTSVCKSKIITANEAVVTMMYQRDFDSQPCMKLYNANLFNGVKFPKGVVSAEDLATIYKVILRAKTIVWSDYAGYFYFLRPTSSEGAGYDPRKYDNYVNIVGQFETAKQDLIPSVAWRAVNCRMLSLLFHLLLVVPPKETEKIDCLFSLVKRYRWGVLTDRHARPKARVAALLSYGGLRLVKIFKKLGASR